MRFLITGGSGLLGSALVRAARSDYDIFYTFNRHPVALPGATGLPLALDGDAVAVREVLEVSDPAAVIHTAGLRSLDYCEMHPDEANRVNVEGTLRLVEAVAERGAAFVFISTESVFDGTRGMYREDDAPNPVTTYGRTKLLAEQLVRRLLPEALIIRTSSIYGKSLYGQSLAEYVLGELESGRPLEMIADSVFSPILSGNLAEAVLELARYRLTGLLHVAGPERCSRYEFALRVARAFGCDLNLVQPARLDDMQSHFRVPRPRDLSLNVSRALSVLRRTRLLTVEEGLHRLPLQLTGERIRELDGQVL